MDREGGNKVKMRKCREWASFHFLIFSPFPHSLSSSSFSHSLSSSSFSHSLSIFSQPGCQAAANSATLVPFAKSQEKCLRGTQTKPISKVGQGLIRLKVVEILSERALLAFCSHYFWCCGGQDFSANEMPNKPQDALWQIRGAHTDDPVWEGGINVHICIYHPSAHPFSSQRNTTRYQICGTIELHRDLISKVLSEW